MDEDYYSDLDTYDICVMDAGDSRLTQKNEHVHYFASVRVFFN